VAVAHMIYDLRSWSLSNRLISREESIPGQHRGYLFENAGYTKIDWIVVLNTRWSGA